MTNNKPSSLVKIVTPKRWAGFSMDFIEPGYTALLVKNGKCVEEYSPGRHINFAMPWLTQCKLYLVNSKELSSKILSNGDFSSKDGCLINIALNIRYRVIDFRRIALEIEDPVTELENSVKDALGIAVQNLPMQKLTREQIKQYLNNEKDNIAYPIGFYIEEIRVDNVDFPQTEGIIRKQEVISYGQQKEQDAMRQAYIAQAGKPEYQIPQQPNINIVNLPGADNQQLNQLPPNQPPVQQILPPKNRPIPKPTQLVDQTPLINSARLIDCTTQQEYIFSGSFLSIGRDDSHHIVIPESNVAASRNHARIDTCANSQGRVCYQITDFSTNGTFVNGKKIIRNQPHILGTQNIIQIGNQQWRFQSPR